MGTEGTHPERATSGPARLLWLSLHTDFEAHILKLKSLKGLEYHLDEAT